MNLGSPDMFRSDFWNSVSLFLTEIIFHDYKENNVELGNLALDFMIT